MSMMALWQFIVLSSIGVVHDHPFLRENAKDARVTALPSGMQYTVLDAAQPDARGPPRRTDKVELQYVGKLLDGLVVDRSDAVAHAPGELMPGLSEVVQLMREGDHWRVWVPPSLGRQHTTTPPKSVIEFDIRVTRVLPTKEEILALPSLERVLRMRIVQQIPVTLRHVLICSALLVLSGIAIEFASCCIAGRKAKAE